MSKKSRRKATARSGSSRPALYVPSPVARPFEGLANELEFAAMRELLPAASLQVTASWEGETKPVTFVTAAPGGAQGVVREDGAILVGLQTTARTADPSHDLGLVTSHILSKPAGTVIDRLDLRQRGPKLGELLGPAAGTLQVHSDLGFWLSEKERTPEAERAIEQSASEIVPCQLIDGQRATFWVRMTHDFCRIVLPDDEDRVFDGLARLRAAGTCTIGSGEAQAHFIGAFRMLGLAVPVWEFGARVEPDAVAGDVADLRARLDEAIATETPLSADERRAREGIVSRQVSIR